MDCDLQDNPAFIVDMFNSYIREKKPVIIEHSYKNFKFRDNFRHVIIKKSNFSENGILKPGQGPGSKKFLSNS
jgi:hypothetical protein